MQQGLLPEVRTQGRWSICATLDSQAWLQHKSWGETLVLRAGEQPGQGQQGAGGSLTASKPEPRWASFHLPLLQAELHAWALVLLTGMKGLPQQAGNSPREVSWCGCWALALQGLHSWAAEGLLCPVLVLYC